MATKATQIDAIKWFFGFTTKEAEDYYRKAGKKALTEIVRGYTQNAASIFYDD